MAEDLDFVTPPYAELEKKLYYFIYIFNISKYIDSLTCILPPIIYIIILLLDLIVCSYYHYYYILF